MADDLDQANRLEAINAYAMELFGIVAEQARARQQTENRWFKDTQQYDGRYDEETLKRLEAQKGASKVYLNQTRPKTRVMQARTNDVLLPMDEPNWDITPTPVPELELEAARQVDSEQDPAGAAMVDEARALRELARRRCDAMRFEMTDQLNESSYEEVCRRVIRQCCKIGIGVAKGPFTDYRQKMFWGKVKGDWSLKRSQDSRPGYVWVDAWNWFPDMEASSMEECEFTFELHNMTRSDLRRLAKMKDFLTDEIRELLRNVPDRSEFSEYERERRLFSGADDLTTESRYRVFEYHGPIGYDNLQQLSEYYDRGEILDVLNDNEDQDPLEVPHGTVWFCQGRILRFNLSHLDSQEIPYSIFRIDPADRGLFGYGIPAMLRDSQSSIAAAWRMVLENGGLSGVPIFIIDRRQIEPSDNSGWQIAPRKTFWRKAPSPDGTPAIEVVQVAGNTQNLMEIIEASRQFADDETSLPLIAQGEQGPHVTKTATGMSLIANAANMIFRDAARSFDAEFTVPNIRRLYHWNMQFSDKENIKGDVQVKAKGSTVLLMRELQAQNIMMVLNIAATNPLLQKIFRVPSLARKLIQSLQLSKDDTVFSDEELQQLAAEPQPPSEKQIEIEGKMQLAELHMKTEILRLSQQSDMSIQRIAADLQKVEMQLASKERLTAAEIAVKEDMGTGI